MHDKMLTIFPLITRLSDYGTPQQPCKGKQKSNYEMLIIRIGKSRLCAKFIKKNHSHLLINLTATKPCKPENNTLNSGWQQLIKIGLLLSSFVIHGCLFKIENPLLCLKLTRSKPHAYPYHLFPLLEVHGSKFQTTTFTTRFKNKENHKPKTTLTAGE